MPREFDRKLHNSCLVDYPYHLNVLTKGIWPSLPESEFEDLDKSGEIVLPPEFQPLVDSFIQESVDTERSFKWSFVRGFVTLELILQGQPILVQMLPIQAIVLLLFQEDEQYSFEMILNRTHISELLLKQVISSLLFSQFQVCVYYDDYGQLLKKEQGPQDGITDQDVYSFNTDFVPPSSSIRLQGVCIVVGLMNAVVI